MRQRMFSIYFAQQMMIIGKAVNCVIVRSVVGYGLLAVGCWLSVAFRKRLPTQLFGINQQDDEAINKHTRLVNNLFCLLRLI